MGPTEMNRIMVGQAGVGGFGRRRRGFLRESGLFELVACYDIDAEAMRACREEDGAQPEESFDALIDRQDIEAVVISTGARFHAQQAIAAMDQGKHVFIEKPLCSTADEMKAILEKQNETGLAIGTGHHDLVHDEVPATIKRHIDTGELGVITAFEAMTASSGGLACGADSWRAAEGLNPGGMLFQCGIHKIHELRYYFGEVTSVSCFMRYDLRPEIKVADSAICTLLFDSGAYGTLHAHYVTPYRHTMTIMGTKANLLFENRFGHGGKHLWRQNQRERFDGGYEPRLELAFDCTTDWCGNLKAFHRMIRTGEAAYPSNRDAAEALKVVLAADESAARQGAPVAIDE